MFSSAATDGSFLSETRYSAYGELCFTNCVSVTDNRYTGQRQETEISLDYYVACFYDPVLAHFVQADSLVTAPGSLQGFDRYAYVMNNPIILSDPSGNKPCEDEFGCSGEEDNVVDCIYVPNSVDTSSTTPSSTTSKNNVVLPSENDPIANSRIESPEINMNFDIGAYKGHLNYKIGIGSDYPENPITITYSPQIEFSPYSLGFDGFSVQWEPAFKNEIQQVNSLLGVNISEMVRTNPKINIYTEASFKFGNHIQGFQEMGLNVEIKNDRLATVGLVTIIYSIPAIVTVIVGSLENSARTLPMPVYK